MKEGFLKSEMLYDKLRCDTIRQLAKSQKLWIKRNENCNFWTFGPACYLDSYEKYMELKDAYNTIFLNDFAGLYSNVILYLNRLLCEPVTLSPRGSWPGFHIYLKDKKLKTGDLIHGNIPHIDSQFRLIYPEKTIKTGDFISFTLALSVPETGSGLEIWLPDSELPQDAIENVTLGSCCFSDSKGPLNDYVKKCITKSGRFIKYDNGHIVIHHGIFLHKPILGADKGDRITLQGHGIKINGIWELFW